MKGKRLPLVFWILMLFASLVMVDIGVGQNSARLYVDPDEIEGVNPCCDPFDIEIRIEDVEDLYAYAFTLRYAPYLKVLVPISVTEGSFLAQGGTTYFRYHFDPLRGLVEVGCTLIPPVEGVSGSGTLVTIMFKVVEAGESSLELSDTVLMNSKLELITEYDIEHGNYKGPRAGIVNVDYESSVNVSEEQTLNATVRKRSDSCGHWAPEDPPLWVYVVFLMIRLEDGKIFTATTEKVYLDTGQEVDLPPVTWQPDNIGTYFCTAIVYFSYHGAWFNSGRRVIGFSFIVY